MEETSKVFGRFNVRIVFPGERYGRTDSLVNDGADPLVEFYDMKHKDGTDWKRGQFVSRYYATAIAGHKHSLQLYDWIEDWRVPAQDMIKISEWIEEKLKEKGKRELSK